MSLAIQVLGLACLGVIALAVTGAWIAHRRMRRFVKSARDWRHPDAEGATPPRFPFHLPAGSRRHLVSKYRTRREPEAPQGPDRRGEFGLPRLDTPQDVVHFLELPGYGALVALADPNRLQSQMLAPQKVRNYFVRKVPKRSGGERIIYAPKKRLKEAQRKILRGILDKVPVHPAATAFRRDSDVRRHVLPHAGQRLILTADLRRFFESIPVRRVSALFRWLGYPPKVAHILGLLCTTRDVGFGAPPEMPHFARHTPQGAPTSPHISNLVCWSLDRRLSGLAKRFGARYTRYADDMAFSGGEDFKRGLARFIPLLRRIVAAEGFQLHEGKLRVLRAGQRQQVTGLVANVTPQPPRAEYDAVKAILHNARKGGGFYAQNRTGERDFLAHVRGRIAWIEQHNPRRGATLNRMLREVVAGLPRHAPPSER